MTSPLRLVWLACLTALCACTYPPHHAVYQPLYARYELHTLDHPESVSRWYECFTALDPFSRQDCLAHAPGVRASMGPGFGCAEPADPALLCRSFPLDPPGADEVSASTDDDADDGSSEIAEGFGRLMVGLFSAALRGGDDDKHAEADHDSRRRKHTAVGD